LAPRSDRLHGELGGVGSDTDIDKAFVGGLVVDPIGRGLAELLILEVVDLDVQRLALRPVVAAGVLRRESIMPGG